MRFVKYALPLVLPLLLLFCADAGEQVNDSGSAAGDEAVFPDQDWASSSPGEQGVNERGLSRALAYLASHSKANGLDETIVIRNGYAIWAGDSVKRVHDIWSCTKSFTSTAAGLMVEEGLIELDAPVADHLPALAEQYPETTFRHFLTMTSGYDAQGSTRWEGDVSEDWSRTPYQPARPLFPPGSAYAYWDEAMIMLGRALTAAADTSLNEYLDERLFSKIGIPKRDWWGQGEVNGQQINFGGTGLRMSASEQARLGWLFLNDGVWNGERILPTGWVEQATQNQVPTHLNLADTDRRGTDGRGVYGYNWWVIRQGEDAPVAAAYTSGLNHNVCLIVPAWNLVLVRQGTDGNPEAGKHHVYSELLKRLASAID